MPELSHHHMPFGQHCRPLIHKCYQTKRSNNYCSEGSLQDICNAPKSPVWAEPDFWHLCLGLARPSGHLKASWPAFQTGRGPSYLNLDWKTNHVWLAASLMKDRNWNAEKAVRFFKFTILFHELMAKTKERCNKAPHVYCAIIIANPTRLPSKTSKYTCCPFLLSLNFNGWHQLYMKDTSGNGSQGEPLRVYVITGCDH